MTVEPEGAGLRLDWFLARRLSPDAQGSSWSRAEIQRLISEGQVTLNGRPSKASARLKVHDKVVLRSLPPRASTLEAEKIPLDVLYEDEHCIVLNKAAGIMVHPASGETRGTLVNALLYRCPDLGGIGGERRPGIVHRLDKDTSGAMVVAKTALAFRRLACQFKQRRVQKEYVALVWGKLPGAAGVIDRPIGRHRSDRKRMSSRYPLAKRRESMTAWSVEKFFRVPTGAALAVELTWLRLRPTTGRTHQLRVHLADLDYPIVGDKVYGRKKKAHAKPNPVIHLLEAFPRQALHAERLSFDHPVSRELMVFTAPLPADLREMLVGLNEWTCASC